MAGIDSAPSSDKTMGNSSVSDTANSASTRLSQEATETGRGHAMHGGNENKDANLKAPPASGIHPEVLAVPGIDVSEFQKTIDWSQVQKSGVQFAYVRASDGTTIQDANFAQNWKGAEQAGLPVGAYHYFTTTSPVQTQIDNFVAQLKTVDAGQLPPVLDVEDPSQFSKLTPTQSVQMVQQWLDGVQQKTGVQPMLYMSSAFSQQVLGNPPQFKKYQLWVADYTTAAQPQVPMPWSDWNVWQYSEKGTVPGITGDVDLDKANGIP